MPTPLPRKNGFTDRRVCRFATLPYYFRCYPRTAATPDGTALHSGASPGMLVLGGGFEPTYLAIISRVPIPNWRPQHSLRADDCQPYYGVPAESRTPDTWIKSPLLYLLSYRHVSWRSVRDLNTELRVLQTAALPFDQPTILSGQSHYRFFFATGKQWHPKKESNPRQRIRNPLYYPLYYSDMVSQVGIEPTRPRFSV